jgi:hypothetical protein
MDDGESVEVSVPQSEADTFELTREELQRTFEYQVE